MQTNDVGSFLIALFAGIILGILFFGGLWYTVRIGLYSKKSGLIFIGSLIIRTGIVLIGFYYVGANNWQKMLVCLGGFLIARTVIVRITKKEMHAKTAIIKDVNDED